MLGIILIVCLIVFLVGGVGSWSPGGYGYGYGHAPIGIGAVLIIVVVFLLLSGHL